MRPRGLFVEKLIQFFEGMRLCECKFNEFSPQNHENCGETTTQSGMEPNLLTNETPSDPTPTELPKAIPSEAQERETLKSLPLLHSSAFLVPSLQMLFELVGYRPWQRSVLEVAELFHRLLKVAHTLNHPLNINHSLRRSGCSLDDLTCLNRQRDILDNVGNRLHCCSFSTKSDSSEEKKRTCPRHRPTWPVQRGRTRVRRRSADESTVRPFTAEETPKYFGPPTLAEAEQKQKEKEQKQTAEIMKLEPEVTNEISDTACEPSVKPSIKTAEALEDFCASVEMEIHEIQSSLSPPPSPLTGKEDGERPLSLTRARNNRLKRKFLAKLPSMANETDERKIASALARKRFLQLRLSKREIRRARRFFRDSMNPSIFSQFCSTKGNARCTERIQWKSDRISKERSVSPIVDIWATLAERDAMLENSMSKCESEPTQKLPAQSLKMKAADEIDLNKLFLKRLADIDPIVPCCCCSCHYRFTGPHKTDMATGVEMRTADAETQTTSFASYDEPTIWRRRKESRTKSEGGIEKQTMRQNVAKGGEKKSMRQNAADGGIEKQSVRQNVADGGIEKQSVRGIEKQSVRQNVVDGGIEKKSVPQSIVEGGIEKQPVRNNVTKRFLDFINDQTSCMTGNKQQRAIDKQETTEFRKFLLSRFLEHSVNHNAKSDFEAELPEVQKPRKEV